MCDSSLIWHTQGEALLLPKLQYTASTTMAKGKAAEPAAARSSSEAIEHAVQVYATARNSHEHVKRPLVVDDVSFAGEDVEFALERYKQPRKWSHIQLSAETDNVRYRASTLQEDTAGSTRPYRYVVGIVDGKSESVKLFDTELFVGKRVVKRLVALEEAAMLKDRLEKEKTPSPKNAATDYYKSRALLGEAFGTKKTKSILHSAERNKINIGQLSSQSSSIGRALDSAIDRIAQSATDEGDAAAAGGPESDPTSSADGQSFGDSILPPHNRTTKNVKDIYPIHLVIPQDICSAIDPSAFARALTERNSTSLEGLSKQYALHASIHERAHAVMALSTPLSEESLTRVIRCLLYVNYLMNFRMLNEAKVNSPSAVLHSLPKSDEGIVASLIRNFTEPVALANGGVRHKLSAVCKDRLIAHVCIITLILDGFRTNLARLSSSLHLPMARTADYMKAIGCVLEKPADGEPATFAVGETGRTLIVKMAVLYAPLKILPPKSMGGGKGRR